jgi:hypothetical protein
LNVADEGTIPATLLVSQAGWETPSAPTLDNFLGASGSPVDFDFRAPHLVDLTLSTAKTASVRLRYIDGASGLNPWIPGTLSVTGHFAYRCAKGEAPEVTVSLLVDGVEEASVGPVLLDARGTWGAFASDPLVYTFGSTAAQVDLLFEFATSASLTRTLDFAATRFRARLWETASPSGYEPDIEDRSDVKGYFFVAKTEFGADDWALGLFDLAGQVSRVSYPAETVSSSGKVLKWLNPLDLAVDNTVDPAIVLCYHHGWRQDDGSGIQEYRHGHGVIRTGDHWKSFCRGPVRRGVSTPGISDREGPGEGRDAGYLHWIAEDRRMGLGWEGLLELL